MTHPLLLTESQRTLVREKLVQLSTAHHTRITRLTKDFESERKRLEDMLRFNLVPQSMPIAAR